MFIWSLSLQHEWLYAQKSACMSKTSVICQVLNKSQGFAWAFICLDIKGLLESFFALTMDNMMTDIQGESHRVCMCRWRDGQLSNKKDKW